MNQLNKKVLLCILSILITLFLSNISFAKQSGDKNLTKNEMEKIIEDIARGGNTLIGGGVPFESQYFKKKPTNKDVITPNWAGGGPNHTHQFIASNGILALKHDKGENVVTHLYEDNGAALIMQYADQPDVDEIDLPYICLGHFYDPTTGENYLGTTDPTANLRFCEHYNAAVANFHSNKALAWQHLGRAIHYVSDLNEPHHAANKLAQITNHSDYEIWVDNNRYNYVVTSCPSETDTMLYIVVKL